MGHLGDGWSRMTPAGMTASSLCLSDLQQASSGVLSWWWQDKRRAWKCASIFFVPLCVLCLLSGPGPESMWEARGKGMAAAKHTKPGLLVQSITCIMFSNNYCPRQTVPSLRGILIPAKTIICFTLLHLVPALHLIKLQNSPRYDIL